MSYYIRSELDLELADALCEQFTPSTIGPSYERNGTWDMPPTLYNGCRFDRAGLPSFAHDRNACAEAEAEIARRRGADGSINLKARYVAALAAELGIDMEHAARNVWYAGASDLFTLITAPPEARVRAMLAVLRG